MKKRKNNRQSDWMLEDDLFGGAQGSGSSFRSEDLWGDLPPAPRKKKRRGSVLPWLIPVIAVALTAAIGCALFLIPRDSGGSGKGKGSGFRDSALSKLSGDPQMVAQPLDGQSAQGSAGSDVMDLMYYAQSVLSFGDESTSGASLVRSFSGSEDGYDALKDYVDLLCGEYDFELAAQPHYKVIKSTFFEFSLNYTGSRNGLTASQEGTYTGTPSNLMIYGTIKNGRLEGAFWRDYVLEAGDDGYRYGQSGKADTQIGQSLTAGLNRLPDGSFETTDGRLRVQVDQAMLLTDGEEETFDAYYANETDKRQLRVYVMDGDHIQQCLYIPSHEDWQEGLLSAGKFIIDADYAVSDRGVSDRFPTYTWESMYTAWHDGDYVYPVRGLSGEMTGLSLRVMYCGDDTLVLYICAAFNSDPQTIEALIAVNTDVSPTTGGSSGNGGNGGGGIDLFDDDDGPGYRTPCVFCSGGQETCSACDGKGGKEVRDNSTPNYSGSTSGSRTSSHWERCFKCSGSGKQRCSHCGGSGWK